MRIGIGRKGRGQSDGGGRTGMGRGGASRGRGARRGMGMGLKKLRGRGNPPSLHPSAPSFLFFVWCGLHDNRPVSFAPVGQSGRILQITSASASSTSPSSSPCASAYKHKFVQARPIAAVVFKCFDQMRCRARNPRVPLAIPSPLAFSLPRPVPQFL